LIFIPNKWGKSSDKLSFTAGASLTGLNPR